MKNMLKEAVLLGKRVLGRIGSEKLKHNFLKAAPFWMGSIITGLIAVAYTRLFAMAEHGTSFIFHHYSYLFFIITPLCFIISWWLVKRFSPYARGSGIPQVMAAIELSSPGSIDKVKRLLSVRIIVVKILSSLVMVFGGGIIGREGPTIQIAGSVFWKINQLLPAWWPKISKKNMIMTGAAAGLAAAFNTPLGGIVFAVEELTRTHISYFKTALFTAIIIAGLTAQAFLGPYLYLGYPDVSSLSGIVFLPVILVAILSGLIGSGISRWMLALFRWKKTFRTNYQHLAYLIVCALIVASAAVFVSGAMFGSGKELITKILFTGDKYSGWHIALFRIIGPVLSFTTGGAGGVFAPSLAAGASIGSLLAGWFHLSATDTNLIILAGMVGFLTGVTRTPFTSAILVLEMTDRHNVIFHLMLAGMAASLAALLVEKHSFYDHLREQYVHDLQPAEKKNGHNDEHPGSGQSILNGQAQVANIVNKLMSSSSWKDSVFFLSYDEGGGPYDHVPPVPGHSNDFTSASVGTIPDISQIAVNPDTYNPCVPAGGTPTLHCDLYSTDPGANPSDAVALHGFAAQLGFRVPNIVISPFTRRHYVSHIPMDHTAIIKFVENRFIGPDAHLTPRDAAQPNLLDFFDFNAVPWSTPPSPPTPESPESLGYDPCTPANFAP